MRISDWSSDVCSSDLGDHCEALACITCPRRFHACVQRQQVGLERDAINDIDDLCDLLGRFLDLVHCSNSAGDLLPDRKRVVEGKSVSVRVDPGVRRFIKKTLKIVIPYTEVTIQKQ